MPRNQHLYNKNHLFGYLLILTAFFILLEISALVQGSEIYFGDYKLVASHLQIPANVLPEILYFIFIQIILHLFYVLLIWGIASAIAMTFRCSADLTEKLGLTLWFAGILFVIVANQYYFPNSKFSTLSNALIPHVLEIPLLFLFSVFWAFIFILSLWGFVNYQPRLFLSVTLLSVVAVCGWVYWPTPLIQDASSAEKPNIIVIGMDALRPDFLGYNGYAKTTPYIDYFMQHATVFGDAFTPIARTFPAWMSILTGQYPKNNHIRFDLTFVSERNWDNTLPNILRREGYETIYSTDETRFSNIELQYGFDRLITPPTGFNDFLFGNLNDFPMANLFVNTPLGKYLFPHSYANRPVVTTYNPDTFLNLVRNGLKQSRSQPLFLSIHFCLPHYPYLWGGHRSSDKPIHDYQAAVNRMDQQFHDFLTILNSSHLLDHAIVVILSDHGEALELSGDRVTEKALFISRDNENSKKIPHFYPPSNHSEAVNQSAGHGTDVLGLTQYHVVLAFKTYGLHATGISGVLSTPASLLDIKPTLLDFLNNKNHLNEDGVSLKPLILGQNLQNPILKHFFYESDFSPQAVRSVHPETRKLLFQGIDYFQVDKSTGRITVKKSMEDLIISSKQLADLYGEWILALYPQNKNQMMPILVNLHSGEWTNNLSTPFASHSPAQNMLKALRQFYGREVTQVLNDS